MRPRAAAALALCLAGLAQAGITRADAAPNSTQGGPPRADAFGGDTPAGDPNGAVRALGRVDQGGGPATVTVPKLGGEGPNETRGLPEGTR